MRRPKRRRRWRRSHCCSALIKSTASREKPTADDDDHDVVDWHWGGFFTHVRVRARARNVRGNGRQFTWYSGAGFSPIVLSHAAAATFDDRAVAHHCANDGNVDDDDNDDDDYMLHNHSHMRRARPSASVYEIIASAQFSRVTNTLLARSLAHCAVAACWVCADEAKQQINQRYVSYENSSSRV